MKFVNIFWIYLALILIPVFGILSIFIFKRYRKILTEVFSLNLIPKMIQPSLFKIKKIEIFIYFLIFCLFFVALSGPQWGLKQQEVKAYGVDIIFGVDVSKSMLTEDVTPNRLEFAKRTISLILDRLQGNRVGVITFAGIAFYHCPLTYDIEAVKDLVSVIDTDIIPYPGTKIGLALEEVTRVFKEYSSGSKVFVLFTDGEDHDSYSLSLVEEAKKNGIIIYTVGVGTPEGRPIPIRDQQGKIIDYKKDKQGNIVTSKLNEALLYEIAEKTQGKYLSLSYGELGIAQQILNDISSLKKQRLNSKVYNIYTNRYHYFVYLILILFLVEIFIPKGWLVKL